MASTQDHISIEDIKDGIVVLKDGGAAVIIRTSAVNFGLLSADEQIAIIGSFAQMLNSLSFPIQITILSKKLDISAYLKLLEKAQALQTNTLLAEMMLRYRRFIQSLIKDNEVLDKQFYITVALSPLELGVGYKNKDEKFKKAQTILSPKRDQVMRQLNRVGLNADTLTDKEILELFYEIYNPVDLGPSAKEIERVAQEKKEAEEKEAAQKAAAPSFANFPNPFAKHETAPEVPVQATTPVAEASPAPEAEPPVPAALAQMSTPPDSSTAQSTDAPPLSPQPNNRTNQPFVVEELPDIT